MSSAAGAATSSTIIAILIKAISALATCRATGIHAPTAALMLSGAGPVSSVVERPVYTGPVGSSNLSRATTCIAGSPVRCGSL